jgi:hypothetical protein
MFYLNTTNEYTDRFDLAKFLNDSDNNGNFILTDSYFITELRKLSPVATYTCTGERPEIAAYNIYSDTQYYEILMLYNSIIDFSTDFVAGTIITYPSLSDLETLVTTTIAKNKISSSNVEVLE